MTSAGHKAGQIGKAHVARIAQIKFHQIACCHGCITASRASIKRKIAVILTPYNRAIFALISPKNDSVHV